MKKIDQNSLDIALNQMVAREVTIVRRSAKEWYFTFIANDQVTKKAVKFALLTQRGKLRTWADPRHLFRFLRERGVTTGNFNLDEDQHYEENEAHCGECK